MNNVISVTQSASTGQIGDLTPQASAGASVTGVEGTGAVSQLQVWGKIVPSQTPNYTEVTETQDPSWTEVTETQDPGWKEVA